MRTYDDWKADDSPDPFHPDSPIWDQSDWIGPNIWCKRCNKILVMGTDEERYGVCDFCHRDEMEAKGWIPLDETQQEFDL